MSRLLLNGIIKNNVFSIYFTEDSSGHIKFGGWEKEGIDPEIKNGSLTLLHTSSQLGWGVYLDKEVQIANSTISINSKFPQARFDPG